MRKKNEFLPLSLILVHFATVMGAMWPFIAQISSVLYDADYLLIAILNVIGTMFLNRVIHRRNDLILPIILLLSLISTLLLIIAYFIVPNYNYGYLDPVLVEWLNNAESHPFSVLFLTIVFCLTNIILLIFKYVARIKEEGKAGEEVKEETAISSIKIFIVPGLLIASFVSLFIGIYGCLSAEFGWISHMPISGFLIGLSTFLLFNIYIRKPQDFHDILIEPQSIKNTNAKTYILTNLIRDFFILFAAFIGFLVAVLMMAVMMSRRIAPVLFGEMFLQSIPFIIIVTAIISAIVILLSLKAKKNAKNEERENQCIKGATATTSLQEARKKWAQTKMNPKMKATASKKGRVLLSRLPETKKTIIKGPWTYVVAPLLLLIPIFTLVLEPQISWLITTFRHDSEYNMILGILFTLSFIPLLLITLQRYKGNMGSSWFVDLIWIALPFVVSLVLDMGFGTQLSEKGDFLEMVTIFLAVTVGFVILQLIFLTLSTIIVKRRMRS